MDYKMEELAPIVGNLANRYASYESTSITYEKAEQLMEAVLYCIRELEQTGHGFPVLEKDRPPFLAYETGAACVKEKTQKALTLYNELLPDFSSYENRCLYETFVKGLPEFFKWYDVVFEPQNTILTLDYPVLKDISHYTGIDRIYEFILCIHWEQKFLKAFPKEYVKNALSKYNKGYKDMVDNLCEIVLLSVAGHILAGKPLADFILEEREYSCIETVFEKNQLPAINRQLERAVKLFVEEYLEGCQALSEYLTGAIEGVAIRLKNAAGNRSLHQIL